MSCAWDEVENRRKSAAARGFLFRWDGVIPASAFFNINEGIIVEIVAATVKPVGRQEEGLEDAVLVHRIQGILGATGAHGACALTSPAEELFIPHEEALRGDGEEIIQIALVEVPLVALGAVLAGDGGPGCE